MTDIEEVNASAQLRMVAQAVQSRRGDVPSPGGGGCDEVEVCRCRLSASGNCGSDTVMARLRTEGQEGRRAGEKWGRTLQTEGSVCSDGKSWRDVNESQACRNVQVVQVRAEPFS